MTPSAPSPVERPIGDERVHTHRIHLLQQRMRAEGIAAVALAGPENIYYLTGLDHFGYFAFTLLVLPETGDPTVITRAMEQPTIRSQIPWCHHATFADGRSPAAVAATVLADMTAADTAVALDDESMFFPPAIADSLRALLPRVRWVRGSGLLTAQRAIKSDQEIGAMRRSAALSDLAISTGIGMLRPGVSERDVAAEVYRAMIAAGGQPPGFPPLIRTTTVLDQEHVSWSDRTLSPGDAVFLELSASVRRYHAPQSRTVYLGEVPSGAAEAAETALAGLLAARSALEPGTSSGQVYAAWQRAVTGRSTRGEALRHHCGYLVGIGFPPSWVGGGEVLGLRAGSDTEIRLGMTFHLMSWVAHPVGHVISDTALVTEAGAELLTTTPRELTILR